MAGIRFTEDTLTPSLAQLDPQLHSAISALIEFYSDFAEGYMRNNAPWTDRTGNARQGLFARAITSGDQYVIIIYHTMPYGIWLEVRWNGRYAIILPTVESVGPKLMSGLRGLFRRMGR